MLYLCPEINYFYLLSSNGLKDRGIKYSLLIILDESVFVHTLLCNELVVQKHRLRL